MVKTKFDGTEEPRYPKSDGAGAFPVERFDTPAPKESGYPKSDGDTGRFMAEHRSAPASDVSEAVMPAPGSVVYYQLHDGSYVEARVIDTPEGTIGSNRNRPPDEGHVHLEYPIERHPSAPQTAVRLNVPPSTWRRTRPEEVR